MVLQLFLAVLTLSTFFLMVNHKRRRIWPILLWVGFAIIGFLYLADYSAFDINALSYQWLNYKKFYVRFAILPDIIYWSALPPLIIINLVLMYLNLIDSYDEFPLISGNIQLLAFANFIFMASATDFIQLMSASCFFSILGFYLLNDIEAKNKFIFYNFAAEMSLFTALSIVYAQNKNLSLDSLSVFLHHGHHQDLVAILVLIAILLKCGMFLFQNQQLIWRNISINRMLTGSLIIVPLSGLVLYEKLYPLLVASDKTLPILYIILVVTIIYALFGMIWINNIKSKILYLNMNFYAFALYLLSIGRINLMHKIIPLMLPLLLINLCLVMIIFSASGEILISKLGGLWRQLTRNLLLTLACIIMCILFVLKLDNSIFCQLWLGTSLLGLATILHGSYLGMPHADERVMALLKNANLKYIFPLIIGLVWLAYTNNLVLTRQTMMFILGFMSVFLFFSQRLINSMSKNYFVQDVNWIDFIYDLLIISPLRLLGRILWLAVDFVVIERSIIGTISTAFGWLEKTLNKFQITTWLHSILLLLLGLILMLLNVGGFIYD